MLTRNLHVAFVLFASLREHSSAFYRASSCLICSINDLEPDSETSRTTDVCVNTAAQTGCWGEQVTSWGSERQRSGSVPVMCCFVGSPSPPSSLHLLSNLLFDEDHSIHGRRGLSCARSHCARIRASAKRLMCNCTAARSHVGAPVTVV